MKIQQKTIYVITKSNWGGAQKYVFDKALSDTKDNIEVIVALGGDGELRQRLEEEGVKTLKIKGLQRDISLLKEFKVFFNLLKIFKENKPTTIHLNSSKIGGLGSLAGRIHNIFYKNTEIIFTAHGWAFNENRNLISKTLIKVTSYLTILLSHRVIVLSKYESKQVTRWPFVRDRIEIEPLELNEIEFIPRENSKDFFRKNLSIKDTNWIVTIAELHKNKGLEYGIEAIRDVGKEYIWIIIGDGEEKDKLQELIDKHDLHDNVILFGYLKDASKYLKAFDLFLLPSIKEGLPYVLLEAKKAGLPILATRVGGIPECFDNEDNIIVNPKDVSKLTQAILKMIK